MAKKISIIIPTYKRQKELFSCLDALGKQPEISSAEIIVVEDSPGGEGEAAVHEFQKKGMDILYCQAQKKGRSQARNEGVKRARGDIIIFIGDDIVVGKNWLKTHIDFHGNKKEVTAALVGHITWEPSLPISRYMKWLENGGPLLDFRGMENGQKTDTYHFYTGNVSLKKKLLELECFSEHADLYGWEDIELGMRLFKKHGMNLWYAKEALAYHNHIYREEDLAMYGENLGFSAYFFAEKTQRKGIMPSWTKLLFYSIISHFSPALKLAKREWYWYALLKKTFLKGVQKAKKQKR